MERQPDENGAAKQLEDVTSDQYSQPIDHQQLITEGSEVSPLQMEQENANKKCVGEGLKVIIVSSISFSIAVTVALIVTIYFGPPQVPPHGGVSCDATVCSNVGAEILQQGGSSVDAAIAATFCMGVVHPQDSGIGGGGVMVIHHMEKKNHEHITKVIDFLEVAPESATKKNIVTQREASVGVPGQVAGLEAAHHLHGKLKWKDVVMPAVKLARNGFNATRELVEDIKVAQLGGGPLEDWTRYDTEGMIIKRPDLANVLQAIADQGSRALYEGTYAKKMSQEVNDKGGLLSSDDMKNYAVKIRDPSTVSFLDVTLASAPSPSAGPIVLSIINILEKFGLSPENSTSPDYFERLIEAMRFGFAEQGRLGDPDFNFQMDNITKIILSESTAEELSAKIIDIDSFPGKDFYLKQTESTASFVSEKTGGSHISVIGPDDYLVSVSSSLNSKFGSQVLTSDGILLNNQMEAFSEDIPNNGVEPGKRPLSPLSPIVVFSHLHPCSSRVAVGGSRGSHLIAGVVQVVMNLLGFQQDIREAASQPRVFSEPNTNDVLYEAELASNIKDGLKAAGNNVQESAGRIGRVNIVRKINETVQAVSDPGDEFTGLSASF